MQLLITLFDILLCYLYWNIVPVHSQTNTTPTHVLFDCLQALFISNNKFIAKTGGGTQWRCVLRHFATRRKVTVSFPGYVTGIFHWHNPSARTMALKLTQPLTDISTWWVKAAGEYEWQHSCADCLEIWALNLTGNFRVSPVLFKSCVFNNGAIVFDSSQMLPFL